MEKWGIALRVLASAKEEEGETCCCLVGKKTKPFFCFAGGISVTRYGSAPSSRLLQRFRLSIRVRAGRGIDLDPPQISVWFGGGFFGWLAPGNFIVFFIGPK